MASPTTAAAPDTPTAGSGAFPLEDWLGEQADFIRDMSPTGAALHETEATVALTDTTNFGPYSGDVALTATRVGKVVELGGVVACLTAGAITGLDPVPFALLEDQFRPRRTRRIRCQGSGAETWLLTITPNGVVSASRYSGTQPAGAWLPISDTYITA